MDNVIQFPKKTTEHRPVAVRSVDEEYAYLDRHFSPSGYRREMQSLISKDGKMYDRLDVVDSRGQKHVFLFDISSFMPLLSFMKDLRADGVAPATFLGAQQTRPAGQAQTTAVSGWTVVGIVVAGLFVYELLSYSAHSARQKHAAYGTYRHRR